MAGPSATCWPHRDAGDVDLAPPTWVTLHDLSEVGTVAEALALAARRDPIPHYATTWTTTDVGAIAIWEGDAGYESRDPTVPGRRHRLLMLRTGWRLERDVF